MKKLSKKYNQMGSYIPISDKEPNSIVTEQYRKLRTHIELSNFNKEHQIIALTSTKAIEGKTVTAINLATVYAQSQIKTLLIDMDLRKPKVHRGFRKMNQVGLSDMITKNLDITHVVQEVSDHLHILTTGTKLPFPAEFLMSSSLKTLIEKLRESYDRIIIDTPPMTAVADASIISRFVDGMILVVASRDAHIDQAKRVINELEQNGTTILGAVLTRVSKREASYMNYYYYQYQ